MSEGKGPPEASESPVFGTARGHLRFELCTPEGPLEDRDDPFMPLSDAGRLGRVLLGRIACGTDTTLRTLAVKLQRSSYRASAGKESLANPQVEELWRRERENLVRCAGVGTAGLLDLGDDVLRSGPVSFCKKDRAYFHPCCPKCGGKLSDCRDDAVLRDHGLPEFSASAARYLHCAACAAKGKKVFYTTAPATEDKPKGDVEVRRRGDLYKDLAAASKEGKIRFPCPACAARGDASAAGAESRWVPVSYYDFHLLPLETLELHFDEWSDLLGGAAWSAVRGKAKQTAGAGRDALLAPLDGPLLGPVQWFYRHDGSGRFPMEVLYLKLLLFAQVCRGVRGYHAKCREPHLDLGPVKVMVRVTPAGSNLPARWGFEAKLTGLASGRRFPMPGALPGAIPDLLVPAADADKVYLSPLVRESEFGHEESMRVSIRSVKAEGGKVKVEGAAVSERARLDAWEAGDVVRIAPSSATGALESLVLWGTLGARQDRTLPFTAWLPAGTLDPAKKPADFDAGVAFYRRFHVPCDLYGLGMLLFRAILVNDQSDVFAVEGAVQRVLKKLGIWLEGKRQPPAARVASEIQALLEQERDAFSSAAFLYSEDDREAWPRAVPPRLWSDLVTFGFRLLTSISGFSFGAGHADYDPAKPEELAERVLVDLGLLERRTRVELFSRADRDREISEVLNEMIAELAGPPKL